MTTINDKVDTLQEDMTQMKADFAVIKADFAIIKTTFKQINGKLDKGFGANYAHKGPTTSEA